MKIKIMFWFEKRFLFTIGACISRLTTAFCKAVRSNGFSGYQTLEYSVKFVINHRQVDFLVLSPKYNWIDDKRENKNVRFGCVLFRFVIFFSLITWHQLWMKDHFPVDVESKKTRVSKTSEYTLLVWCIRQLVYTSNFQPQTYKRAITFSW